MKTPSDPRERLIDALGLLLMAVFFISYLPKSFFLSSPPTGGDTGSHFWALQSLVEHGIGEGRIRLWNPGNLMGEPLFLHYFPFPFLLMWIMSLVLPLGLAFKVASFVQIPLFPLSVYLGARGLGLKFPAPILAAASSLFLLSNESFSAWGGNNLSTLAGQFAHQQALLMFFLLMGCIGWELRTNRKAYLSALLLSLIAITHSYVFLLVPFIFLSFIFAYPVQTAPKRLTHVFTVGLLGSLAASWFMVPMLMNTPWTTPVALIWALPDILSTILPKFFRPLFILTALTLFPALYAFYKGQLQKRVFGWPIFLKGFGFFLIPFLASILMYFIFPKIGLVDVRAIPHLQVLLCVACGIWIGSVLHKYPSQIRQVLTMACIAASLYLCSREIKNFPFWLNWNDSGWESKTLYPDLVKLSAKVRGSFSDPRIAYENNEISGQAGTPRVFEMLPYFASRSTLESVYTQANIMAPYAYLMQALISKTPSCPIRQYPCPPLTMVRATQVMDLLGVSDLILITAEARAQADQLPELVHQADDGPWHLYSGIRKPLLYQKIDQPLKVIARAKWKADFFEWFMQYKFNSPFLVVGSTDTTHPLNLALAQSTAQTLKNPHECNTSLRVEMNHIDLQTNCIGQPLILKFAYHPSWKANSGDAIYLVSPGYMALIPSRKNIRLEFGKSLTWDFFDILSLLLTLGLAVLLSRQEMSRHRSRQ